MKTGRRSFLKGVGGATAAAFATRGQSAEAAPAPTRGARQLLELDGGIVGTLQSVEGGAASAIVSEFLDSGFVVRKDVTGVSYDPIHMTVGLGMSESFFDWVGAFFARDFRRKNGTIVAADFNFREASRREFQEALITEVSFPALDASKKEPAYMEVKIQPESTHFKPGSGGKVESPSTSKAKSWLASNFAVELSGLESAVKRVNKVEGFAVKMKFLEQDGIQTPSHVEFPNLVLQVPAQDAQPFLDWFEDFVIRGNSSPEQEKKGAIVGLSPNRQEELIRIELAQVGIVSVGEAKSESNSDAVRRFQIELYVEEMKFQIPGGVS